MERGGFKKIEKKVIPGMGHLMVDECSVTIKAFLQSIMT